MPSAALAIQRSLDRTPRQGLDSRLDRHESWRPPGRVTHSTGQEHNIRTSCRAAPRGSGSVIARRRRVVDPSDPAGRADLIPPRHHDGLSILIEVEEDRPPPWFSMTSSSPRRPVVTEDSIGTASSNQTPRIPSRPPPATPPPGSFSPRSSRTDGGRFRCRPMACSEPSSPPARDVATARPPRPTCRTSAGVRPARKARLQAYRTSRISTIVGRSRASPSAIIRSPRPGARHPWLRRSGVSRHPRFRRPSATTESLPRRFDTNHRVDPAVAVAVESPPDFGTQRAQAWDDRLALLPGKAGAVKGDILEPHRATGGPRDASIARTPATTSPDAPS